MDLTILCDPNIKDALLSAVLYVLKAEQVNEAAQYTIKEAHSIEAPEVKLVKCIVQDIVVDITFNQIGGLYTLCFLEQVDSVVGKDHLFKRSIILIKAWCYYESRVLGSHHGLISTYALETLVIYIFHHFHSSLTHPLQVLYKFLDYFSKFDWNNCCVHLSGPVCKASLPDIVAVGGSEHGGDDELLSQELINNFTVPLIEPSTNFPTKFLNIFDPLKENNNLGRSVNQGNFHRICRAFKHGANELRRVLSLPGETMEVDLNKFFVNTIQRHKINYGFDLDSNTLASDDLSSSFKTMCFKNTTFPESPAVGCTNNDNVEEIKVTPRTGFTNDSSDSHQLLDLSGDYDSQVWNLQYGYALTESTIANSPALDLQSRDDSSVCETIHDRVLSEQIGYSQANKNGAILGVPWLQYPSNSTSCNAGGFGSEDKRKVRGIGTYFPRTNYSSCSSNGPSQGEIRNEAQSSGRNPISFSEKNNQPNSSPENKNQASVVYQLKDEADFPPLSPRLAAKGSRKVLGFC